MKLECQSEKHKSIHNRLSLLWQKSSEDQKTCVFFAVRDSVLGRFFSAFFDPASSILIGNLILYSNHSIKLLVLIGSEEFTEI